MAHQSEVTGKYSETAARLALMANGWTVHTAETDEAYDILATDPATGEHKRIQVKTIRVRHDRGTGGVPELVVYAKRGNGAAYTQADADYIVGVLAAEGAPPRVFMFENRSLSEYWCSEAKAAERWVELPIALDRSITEAEGA